VRFKVDENLPVEVAEVLRAAGHDAATVKEEAAGGAQDPVIAQLIRKEARALVTLDTGFMDIRSYPPRRGSARRAGGRPRPGSGLEVLEEGPDRHPSPLEHPGAAHLVDLALDGRALTPVQHGAGVQQPRKSGPYRGP
jgi:hypothetical protein